MTDNQLNNGGDEAVRNMGSSFEEICVSIPSSGGILGLIVSDKERINKTLKRYNNNGYNMIAYAQQSRSNILYLIVQILCLFVTLFVWTPASAGLLFFRRALWTSEAGQCVEVNPSAVDTSVIEDEETKRMPGVIEPEVTQSNEGNDLE